MPRVLRWGAVILLAVVTLVVSAVPVVFAAQVSLGDGGGGGSGGPGSASNGSKKECPSGWSLDPSMGLCYTISTRDAYDTEIPERTYYIGTGRWEWWSDVSYPIWIDWDPGYPQYNVWRYDPSSDKPLRYDFVRIRSEGPYYIEDEYRPLVRKFYDMWQLEHGRVYAKSVWWAERYGWPQMTVKTYEDGRSYSWPAGTYNPNRTSVTFNNYQPLRGIHYCPTTCAEDFPNPNSRSPRRPLVKAPPIYDLEPDGREKPPLLPPPQDWLGDQIDCDNCQHKDVYDPNGVFLFGGRPSRNLFSGTRGRQAVFGLDALSQGNPSVPPAKNRVDEVIVRVPDLGIGAKMALYEGDRQKGQWITALVIPPDARIGRYRVEFTVRGSNFWGEPREKIVYGWLQVDGGSCAPTDRRCQMEPPGPVSYCGLSEDAMRELGDRWVYHCMDPRLVR